ncbi:MAG TPA: hypothetical protein PL017_02675 [Tenuifilaceae bacterium]|nr:hypothetical protein [Tenuifilaceae bacterium]HPE17622.1 hypothetical protein [Tenuifilaceae bacterium]HPJ44975.1 hypothetical protein [Tenuifilaceae bacterium]HPQ33778.1 hypothetical protein [Tenuifilaceae bacterium]
MIRNMKNGKFLIYLLLPVIMSGCYLEDFEKVKIEPINPSYVLPVINSTITFRELVERSDANTLVDTLPGTTMFYMAFRDTMQLSSASELFTFTPLSYSQDMSLPVPPDFPVGSQVGEVTETFTESSVAVFGAELKEARFSGGTLSVRIENDFHHQVSGSLRITSLVNTVGSTYVLPFNLNTQGSSTSDTRALSNYIMNLYNSDDDTYNTLTYEVKATLTSSGNPSTEGSIKVYIDVTEPEYELLVGSFNASFLNESIKYYINVFSSTLLADQYFEEPSLALTAVSSFGVPMVFQFTEFEFINNIGDVVPVTNSGVPTAGDLNVTDLNIVNPITSTTDESMSSTYLLNATNSNITDAFEIAPSILDIDALFNIGDNADDHEHFVKSNSSISFISDITLPLYGRITTHIISDTLANFSWPELGDLLGETTGDSEPKVMVKFKFSNGIPFDMAFQAEFLDADGNMVDQFFSDDEDDWFIDSAPVDANGEASGITEKYSTIEMTKTRYEELSASNSIVFFYRLHTGGTDGQSVKILTTNTIGVQMSVYATLSIDLSN